MKKFRLTILVFAVAVSLSGCAGFGGLSGDSDSNQSGASFDINADIDKIAKGVSDFDSNSRLGLTTSSLEQFINVNSANGRILGEITLSVDEFISHIKSNWDVLPTDDTAELPSRDKLLNWANGYKTWLSYQLQIQGLARECEIASSVGSSWDVCVLGNSMRTQLYERLSKTDLESAITDIQLWQAKRSDLNG